MSGLKLSVQPREARLKSIISWLKDESDETMGGFYCNREIICQAFQNRDLFCVTRKGETLGFIVFSELSGQVVRLEIASIHHKHRREGIGRFMIDSFMAVMRLRGKFVIRLDCMPETSQYFWSALGFIPEPKNITPNICTKISMYKSIYECQPSGEYLDSPDGVIELWDKEPWDVEGVEPSWCWGIKQYKGRLETPIVHPAARDWCIQWRVGSVVKSIGKVKYFCEQSQLNSYYLILDSLPVLIQ